MMTTDTHRRTRTHRELKGQKLRKSEMVGIWRTEDSGKMEEKRTKKIRSCENEGKRGQRSEIGGRRIEDNGVRIRD